MGNVVQEIDDEKETDNKNVGNFQGNLYKIFYRRDVCHVVFGFASDCDSGGGGDCIV